MTGNQRRVHAVVWPVLGAALVVALAFLLW